MVREGGCINYFSIDLLFVEYLWIDHDHIANVMKSICEKDGGSPPHSGPE